MQRRRVRFNPKTWVSPGLNFICFSAPEHNYAAEKSDPIAPGWPPSTGFFFGMSFAKKRQGACLPNPATACRPPDKKRRQAAPCSGSGCGAGLPGHSGPEALRLCWADYRWCPSTGLSRGREARKGVGREGRRPRGSQSVHSPSADRFCLHQVHAGCGEHKAGRTEGAGSKPGAGRGPCARACSDLWVGRGAGGVSPGGGNRAVASLGALGTFLGTWPLSAPPSAPQFYPPSQSCLPVCPGAREPD